MGNVGNISKGQKCSGMWASLVAQMVKNLPAMQETPTSIPRSGRSPGEGIGYTLQYSWASLVSYMVKNPPAMWETWVRSMGWEDLLEEGIATHSRIPAWRIPMDRGAWWATVHRFTNYCFLMCVQRACPACMCAKSLQSCLTVGPYGL